MVKTILFVAGGIEAVQGIQKAKRMGLRIVVSDIDPKAPGFQYADDCLIVSAYDVESTVNAAIQYSRKNHPINAVISVGADVPLTLASVAEALGLPGNSLASARLAADKLAMKQKFTEDRVPVPWFCQVNNVRNLTDIVRREGYPLVLKPVDSRGARGVLRLTEKVDLEWAYQESHRHSPTGRVMVERFLPGPQVSTESLVVGSAAYTPGFADRNYEFLERYAPFIIENGGELPSSLPEKIQKLVRQVVQQAANSMGITNGVVKGDIVVYNGKPYVIELAARLSGGYFCSVEIPLNTGVDFVEQAIRQALGERINPVDLLPKFQRGVAQRYLFPEPGRVIRISGPDTAYFEQGIEMCEIRVSVGDIIKPIENHPARAGVIIATGDTREEALKRAELVHSSIKIETVPI